MLFRKHLCQKGKDSIIGAVHAGIRPREQRAMQPGYSLRKPKTWELQWKYAPATAGGVEKCTRTKKCPTTSHRIEWRGHTILVNFSPMI